MMNIAEKVHELMKDCLQGHLAGSVEVKVIMNHFLFDPAKIKAHKEEIRELLNQMPPEFHAGKGGGMTFLNMCMDKDGNHWGEHPTMESLIGLGMAAGFVTFPLPREMWNVLPGSMPYVTIDTQKA